MKRICGYLSVPALLIFGIPYASGQSAVDINVGLGGAHAKASGSGIDSASSPTNAFGTCVPSSGDSFCQSTPSLSGVFMGIGGDVMFKKQFGMGAQVNFQPARQDYGPLQYRETFFDVNGIYAPIQQKRVALRLEGGVGVARTGFSFNSSACVGSVVCSSQNEPVGSASHFQVHVGAGVQIYLTEHIFVRPQFDLHYVPGFRDQFGSNVVPAGTIWVGYNLGHNQ